MTLKNTINTMKTLLSEITQDLQKADGGNKAASQRVRTGTVKLEKVAKLFRKESIKNDKTNKGRKKPASASAKKASKPMKKSAPQKPAKHKKASSRAHAMSFRRRQTAKLPSRRAAR